MNVNAPWLRAGGRKPRKRQVDNHNEAPRRLKAPHVAVRRFSTVENKPCLGCNDPLPLGRFTRCPSCALAWVYRVEGAALPHAGDDLFGVGTEDTPPGAGRGKGRLQ